MDTNLIIATKDYANEMWKSFWWLANTEFFSSLITMIVGLAAYSIYTKQVNDKKIGITNAILLEIKNASEVIGELKSRLYQDPNSLSADDINIMPENTWEKNKSLYTRDLTNIEWTAVSNFYHYSQLLDNAISYQKTFFEKNELNFRENLHRVGADMASKIKNDKKLSIEFQKFYDRLYSLNDQSILGPKNMWYQPRKPLLDVKNYLSLLPSEITTLPLYAKLESISMQKNNFFINIKRIFTH